MEYIRAAAPIVISENIDMNFLLYLSAAMPAAGLRTAMGIYATNPEMPSMRGEDVSSASHHMSANCTPLLPSMDIACPDATSTN